MKLATNLVEEVYQSTAEQYRQNDELHVTGADYRRVRSILENITSSFARPVDVLEAGCGTGRYFHCLRNVNKLTGVDLAPQMLEVAKNPVLAEEVTAREVELVCSDFNSLNFPAESFDFIYCLGVFGNGCCPSRQIFQKYYRWLRPSGKLFFDSFDESETPLLKRLKAQTRAFVYLQLPVDLQKAWDRATGWPPFFAYSSQKLNRILSGVGFRNIMIQSQVSNLTVGVGRKFECFAEK